MTPEDRDMMIRTIVGEADDQSDRGKAAVAHAILNRVADGRWGDTPSKVVLSRGQFEPWSTRAAELNNIDPESRKYQRTGAIVDEVIGGKIPDETGGATHFLDPVMVRKRRGGSLPDWASEDGATVSIGDHRFYRPKEMGGQQAISAALKDGAASSGLPAAALPFADDDFIERERRRHEQPAPTAAATQGDDFIERERRRWGEQPAKPAEAKVAQKPQSAEIAQSGGLPQATIDLLKGSQGHGEGGADSWGDWAGQAGAGAVRGVGDVADTLAQGIGYAGDKGAGLLSRLGVISPESRNAVSGWREGVNRRVAEGNAAWDAASGDRLVPQFGRVGGQIAGTAPFLAAGGGALSAATRGAPIVSSFAKYPTIAGAVRGAAGAAGTTGLTSSSSDEPIGEQMTDAAMWGGAFGAAGGKLFGKSRKLDKETADLADKAVNKYGIPLQADQLSSNLLVRHAGAFAKHLPFTGLGEHAAEQHGAWQRAIAKEMGEKSDKLSSDVINQALDRSGMMMDDVAKRTGSIAVDRPFINEAMRIATDAQGVLAQESKPVFNQIDNIANRIHGGQMDAKAYQTLFGHGSQFDIALRKHTNGTIREYLGQLKNAVNDMMERSAPADAVADLKTARYQYAIAKAVEPLAENAPVGNISPGSLLSRAKGGNLTELGKIGKQFMKPPPSSGTPEKIALGHLAGKLAAGVAGAGGIGAAYHFAPDQWQQELGLAGAGVGAMALGGAALKAKLPVNRIIRGAQRGVTPLRITVGPSAAALESRRVNTPEQTP